MSSPTLGVQALVKATSDTDIDSFSAGTVLGSQTDATLTINGASVDITAKLESTDDDYLWEEYLPGYRSWEVECNALHVPDDTAYGYFEDQILSATTPTVVEVQLAVPYSTGTQTYYGIGVVTSVSITAPTKEASTVSISIQGTGALAVDTP